MARGYGFTIFASAKRRRISYSILARFRRSRWRNTIPVSQLNTYTHIISYEALDGFVADHTDVEDLAVGDVEDVGVVYGGRCPRCGRTLSEDVYEIVVEGVRLAVNGAELIE
jgi:hypothetical protein